MYLIASNRQAGMVANATCAVDASSARENMKWTNIFNKTTQKICRQSVECRGDDELRCQRLTRGQGYFMADANVHVHAESEKRNVGKWVDPILIHLSFPG